MLADAADVLSDQLRLHLERLSLLIMPHAKRLDGRFHATLAARRYDARQIKALTEITPGAAARILTAGRPPAKFLEVVEYNGRRLAKLNVAPAGILRALRAYDRVLDPVLARSRPAEYKNLRWAREQLQFCTVLTLNNAYYQVREAETQAFYELSRAELQSSSLADLLNRLLQTLVKFCHAEDGLLTIFRDDKPGPTKRILKQLSKPRLIARESPARSLVLDPNLCERYPWFWSVPLMQTGGVAGVLQLAFSKEYGWLPRELELLETVAERCLEAAGKVRLLENLAGREKQVRRLSEHMMEVEEEERRRISRELHDEAGQSLLCVRLKLELLEQDVPPELCERITEVRQMTEYAIAEIRRIIAALSPAVLEQLGLAAALRQLVKQVRGVYSGQLQLRLPPKFGPFPKEIEIAVFRLVQECFHNITKHAEASTVNVSLDSTDKTLRLTVADDGVGFDVSAAADRSNSFGLAGMRERVTLLGGRFDIQSGRHRGTRITVELPVSSRQKKGSAGKAAAMQHA